LAHCDYWWFAGSVEWCDLTGGSCRCGGWEEACEMKQRRRRPTKNNTFLPFEPDFEERKRTSKHASKHNHIQR
jgi:hypothetical protein